MNRQRTLPLPDADADERAKATGSRVVALKVKGARYWATVRKSPAVYVSTQEKGHVTRL